MLDKSANFPGSLAARPFAKPRRGFWSIANQLRFSFLALVLLSLLPTGGALIYLSSQAQQTLSQELQAQISQGAAAEVNNYLDDLQRKVAYLARVPGLADLPPPVLQSLLKGLTRHNDAYEAIAILDEEGRVVTAISSYMPVMFGSWADTPAFGRALRQQEEHISPVEIDPVTKTPYTLIAVPIRDRKDQVSGVLMAQINLNFLWFVISQTQVGKTGYTYIVDERNKVIAEKGLTPETAELKTISDSALLKSVTSPLADNRLQRYRGLRGKPVFGAIARVRSVNWNVVVELPLTEAYAPVRRMLRLTVSALLLFSALAAAGGFVISRRIVRPLRQLTHAAARIRDGYLETQVSIRGDNELGLLATTFNTMTSQLRELVEAVEVERNFVSAILETAGALVMVLDAQGRIVRFNQACERVSGYAFQEVENRPFWDYCLAEGDRAAVAQQFGALQVGQFPRRYEGVWVTKSGESRFVTWSDGVLLDDEGAIAYVVSTGIDITERKQAEYALEESEERLQAILDNSPAVIYLKDLDNQFLLVNRQFERLFGVQRWAVKGQRDAAVLPEAIAAKLRTYDSQVITWGHPIQGELSLCQGEDLRTYLVSQFPLYDASDALCALCSILTDISDRKQAEDEVRQAKEAAEVALQNFHKAQTQLIQAEKMSSLGQLVAGIAHEINNPVNFIYGNLSHADTYAADLLDLIALYQEHYPEPHPAIRDRSEDIDLPFLLDDLPKILTSMRIGADRIRQIVLSLRNFSRIDEADMKAVDIHEGIDSTLLILQSRLKPQENRPTVKIVREYGALPPVECFPGQLNQVFMNLIANAIDALESVSDPNVNATLYQPRPQISIRTQANSSDSVSICIADNGPGMSPQVQTQLFNPFFTTKPVGKGTGLGLSISYQIIVDKHGGSLRCVSEVGTGTEFWIEIPVHQPETL